MEKVTAHAIEDIYELSPMQQGMLFESLYAPESGVYVSQLYLELDASLNVPAFRQAWQALLDRHPILRTLFLWEETDSPLQVVRANANLPWAELDWRTVPDGGAALTAWLQADRQQGFALDQAPLMRCTLIRLDNEFYHFVWTYHHLICDGWSLSLLQQELLANYQALCSGRYLASSTPRPYRDYVLWLRRQDRPLAEAFWRAQVQDFSAPTPLTVDRKSFDRSTQGHDYATEEYALSPTLTTTLLTFAQQRQVTLNTLVQGAWALLLSRYSGNQAVLFGATVAGRPASLAGVEQMVGLFINTIPVAVSAPAEQRLIPWLQHLQQTQAQAQEYAYQPLTAIQTWSGIPHGAPLFESILVFENYPVDATQLNAAFRLVKDVHSFEQTNYPLTIGIIPGQALTFAFSYDTRRFDGATIRHIFDHLQTILHGMVANPEQSLGTLPLLTAAERQQLLIEWNDTATVYPHDQCVHQIFEAQVARQPDAVAITLGQQQISYGQLNAQANQVAHHLQALGVGPETLVGICLERTPLVFAAVLGVLKAGAAYVPIDPAYPAQRIAYMLNDAQVRFLLTTANLSTTLPESTAQVVLLDDGTPVWQAAKTNLDLTIALERLAYVIYTSGSTGQPKGVMVAHGNFVNAYRGWETRYQLHGCRAHLQMASFSFDVFGGDLVRALCSGAKLVLCPRDLLLEAEALYALMRAEAVECAEFVPAVLRHLLDYLEYTGQDLAFMRLVIAGSDVWYGEEYRRLLRCCGPHTRLINSYGITETTIDSTFFEHNAAMAMATPLADGALVPIGRPFPNVQCYVLDLHGQPAPVGVVGELYIGGAGVALGYLNRPELTAEKFTANPFGSGRVYKTGDLARWLADGNLEYLGRIDQQVKIHGFRIELGEIEALLTQHPDVQAAVVAAREDTSGSKRLVAYVVLVQPADLRSYLRAQLPEYMVPSTVVQLDALPLTPNGKVDRKALPAPNDAGLDMPSDIAAEHWPYTPVEAILSSLWQQVLRLTRVRLDDNFFTLGGDSILSLQVVARARQAGLHLTPRQIFQHQTIRQLAAVATPLALPSAPQEMITGSLPLTPIQQEFFAQAWTEPHHYNQAVLLETAPEINVLHLQAALTALLLHHDALRLRFRPGSDGWEQENAPAGEEAALAVVDLSSLSPAEQSAALAAEAERAQTSLELTNGPLLCARLFTYGAQAGRLLLVIHHLAVDGVSWRILLEDLQAAYQQLSQGQPVQLPAKTTAFRDWAHWLATEGLQHLAGEQVWWQQVAAQCCHALPVDDPSGLPTNTVASIAEVVSVLPATETAALLHEAPAAYHTQINDLLLTALAQTISRWSGAPQVALDLEGHGRELVADEVAMPQPLDLSRTVGWFTSQFPVVLNVNTDTPGPLIQSIKEQLRRIPNRGIGYGVLRYLGQVAALLPPVPPAISFNYLGQFDTVLAPQERSFLLDLAQESTGPYESPAGMRSHLLDVNALVTQGELRITWRYSSHCHRPSTIEQVAQTYLDTLRHLIAHCCGAAIDAYTPSDFTAKELEQGEIDQWLVVYEHKIEDIYELSPMQQGMLFESLYAPASGVYVTQLCLTLDASLNVAAFRQAWQALLEQHPILRTLFIWQREKMPLQLVRHQAELPWQELDWRNTTHSEAALAAWLQADSRQGFALDQAPLVRCTLIRSSAEHYYFVWTQHHLISDGWSTPLLLQELVARYRAACAGHSLKLPAPRPYRDYILWLRKQDRPRAEAFWRDQIQRFIAPTPLILDQQPVARGTHVSDYLTKHYALSAALTAALTGFAQQQQVTLNTLIQGAWALLLSRYSGNQDVLFGAAVAGRPPTLAGVESMVGLFINSIPVAVTIPAHQPLLPWLQHLQQTQAAAQEFVYLPLPDIQNLSNIPRGTPLFESLLVFENYPVDMTQLDVEPALVSSVRSYEQNNFPLTIAIIPGESLTFAFSYDTRRFDEDAIMRLFGHLQTLLQGMTVDPLRPIDQIPLLTAEERQQLLVDWNNTATTYPQNQCIHHLFEAQVARTPDAIAIVYEEQQLTYAQLNERANQLAHYLQALGIGPDEFVGLCVDRSLEMVIGLLGILKAGGAYLPLDPTYPAERIGFMLEDAKPAVIIQQAAAQLRLPTSVHCILSDQLTTLLAGYSTTNPGNSERTQAVTSQNLAYVIYTSGSTGRPKGVLLPHAGLCNLAQAQIRAFGVQPAHRVLQVASLNFDASISEIMMALCAGAVLVLARAEHLLPGEALTRTLQQQAITHVTLVPSSLAQLKAGMFPQLQTLIVAGEACPPALAALWAQQHHLFNAYGPTEITVCATIMDCAQWHNRQQGPPIGQPIANTQAYILDAGLQPAPLQVVGELYIGGTGVALGYLNRPELTQEKFIDNPFGPGRLYRTGDRARWLPDGTIEYLGRIDHQVKIRGFRIELGEIEALLTQHPIVKEAVVVAREDAPGEKRLVAYIVPMESPSTDFHPDFRVYLQAHVPDYMIPGAFVHLESLPLTPNGKIDRSALAGSDFDKASAPADFVAPRSRIEVTLCNIWTEVLGVDQVGIHDNFFALGGHSLYAIMVMNRISEELAVELPLAVLFDEQTIALLAAAIEIELLAQTDQDDLLQALTEV